MELLPTELSESHFTKSCYLFQNSLVYDQRECLKMELLSTGREDRLEKWLKWIFVCVIAFEHLFEALTAIEIRYDFYIFLSRETVYITLKKFVRLLRLHRRMFVYKFKNQ